MFGVSHQTIKKWCAEFENHLSPSATPEKGKTRRFTEDDVKVLALVSSMKAAREKPEDIHATLASGQRGILPDMRGSNLAVSTPVQIAALQQNIAQLQQKLRVTQDENEQFKGQNELLKEQIKEAKQEIRDLYRQLARLEAGKDGTE